MSLHREDGLRGAEATKSAVRRNVCSYGLGLNANGWPIVRSTGMDRPTREDNGRESLIGSAVDRELDFTAQDLTITSDRGTVAGP